MGAPEPLQDATYVQPEASHDSADPELVVPLNLSAKFDVAGRSGGGLAGAGAFVFNPSVPPHGKPAAAHGRRASPQGGPPAAAAAAAGSSAADGIAAAAAGVSARPTSDASARQLQQRWSERWDDAVASAPSVAAVAAAAAASASAAAAAAAAAAAGRRQEQPLVPPPPAAVPRAPDATPASVITSRISRRTAGQAGFGSGGGGGGGGGIGAGGAAAPAPVPVVPASWQPPVLPPAPAPTPVPLSSWQAPAPAPPLSAFGARLAAVADTAAPDAPLAANQPQPAQPQRLPVFAATFVPGTPGDTATKRGGRGGRTPGGASRALGRAAHGRTPHGHTPLGHVGATPPPVFAPLFPPAFNAATAGGAAFAAASVPPAPAAAAPAPAAPAPPAAAAPAAAPAPPPQLQRPASSAMSWSPADSLASKGGAAASSVAMPFRAQQHSGSGDGDDGATSAPAAAPPPSSRQQPWAGPSDGGSRQGSATPGWAPAPLHARSDWAPHAESLAHDLDSLDILRDTSAKGGAAAKVGGGAAEGGDAGARSRAPPGRADQQAAAKLLSAAKAAVASAQQQQQQADVAQQRDATHARGGQQQQQQQAASASPFPFSSEPAPSFAGFGATPGGGAGATSGVYSYMQQQPQQQQPPPASPFAFTTRPAGHAAPSPFSFRMGAGAPPFVAPPAATAAPAPAPAAAAPAPAAAAPTAGPTFTAAALPVGPAPASGDPSSGSRRTARAKKSPGRARASPSAPAKARAAAQHQQQQGFQQQQAQHQQQKPQRSAAEVAEATALASSHKEAGNVAFQAARYVQAEVSYTLAINALSSVSSGGIDLAVLHSNRAGARLMIGKPIGALDDATRAVALDPKFTRAAVRVATCHLRCGEFGAALAVAARAAAGLPPGGTHAADVARKARERGYAATHATAGLPLGGTHAANVANKSHEVEGVAAAVDQLRQSLCGDVVTRERLSEVLAQMEGVQPQVLYSEEVAAMRARCLLQAGRLEDVEEALAVPYEGKAELRGAPWRHWLRAQTRYHQGDLTSAIASCDATIVALSKPGGGLGSMAGRFAGGPDVVGRVVGVPSAEGVRAAAEHCRRLADLKEQGNAAVKSKQLAVAVERYSEALVLGSSVAYAAVLHSNRAAAHQGLGNLTDALADCARARALDPSFVRAHTRMAALMTELRRHDSAESLLAGLLTASDAAAPAPSSASLFSAAAPAAVPRLTSTERGSAAAQMSEAKASARWQRTPDHFALLALARACGDDDVKRAYRKAALRYHPDKAMAACRFALAMPVATAGSGSSGGGADAATSAPTSLKLAGGPELEARVREEAGSLFNLINAANEELGDATRRKRVVQLLEAEAAAAGVGARSSSAAGTHHRTSGGYHPSSSYRPTSYAANPGGYGSAAGATPGYGAGYAAAGAYRRPPGSTYGTSGYGTGAGGSAAGAGPTAGSAYSRYFNSARAGAAGAGTGYARAGSAGAGPFAGGGSRWYEAAGGGGAGSDSDASEYV
ncbi:hypothetical protein FOA52_002931 [Chlamydomonas sp. UWO 241]|nr:hypothetical protein FOA52_002931 [Chlamydomonas sp. UWO 241]